MSTETADLEEQIRLELRRRALSLPERVEWLPAPADPAHQSARPRAKRIAVAVSAVILVVFVVAAVWNVSRTTSRHAQISADPATTAPAADIPTTTVPLPATITGDEVPLAPVSTPDTDFVISQTEKSEPGTSGFIVVQAPDRAPVIVYRGVMPGGAAQCMTIANEATAAQGACLLLQQAQDVIVGTLDSGYDQSTVAYGVWATLPPGTEYVTFTYGMQHQWQRPVNGVSLFTTQGARPAFGPEPATMRAFDAQGNELGHATRTPYVDGAGEWRW